MEINDDNMPTNPPQLIRQNAVDGRLEETEPEEGQPQEQTQATPNQGGAKKRRVSKKQYKKVLKKLSRKISKKTYKKTTKKTSKKYQRKLQRK